MKIESMSIEDYHSNPAISKSKLDQINKSILHYKEPSNYSSTSLEFGSALHDIILQPEVFQERFMVQPDHIKVRRGKEWDKVIAEFPDKIILKKSDWERLHIIRDRVMDHPLCKNMLVGGKAEESYFTKYGDVDSSNPLLSDMDLRCRPDYVNKGIIFDLKSTQSAQEDSFKSSITKYRYNVQAAFYMDVINAVEKPEQPYDSFVFIAVETSPPYAIGIYNLNQEAIDWGRADYIDDLTKLALYNENPYTPTGYTDNSVQTIGCNEYYYHKKIKGI